MRSCERSCSRSEKISVKCNPTSAKSAELHRRNENLPIGRRDAKRTPIRHSPDVPRPVPNAISQIPFLNCEKVIPRQVHRVIRDPKDSLSARGHEETQRCTFQNSPFSPKKHQFSKEFPMFSVESGSPERWDIFAPVERSSTQERSSRRELSSFARDKWKRDSCFVRK